MTAPSSWPLSAFSMSMPSIGRAFRGPGGKPSDRVAGCDFDPGAQRADHSSLSDEFDQRGALESLAGILVDLRQTLRLEAPDHPLCPDGPTMNLAVKAEGGVGFGVLPGDAVVWGDVRTVPGMTHSTFERDMELALDRIRHDIPMSTSPSQSPRISWLGQPKFLGPPPWRHASTPREVLGEALPLRAFPGGSDAWAFQGIAAFP